MDKAVASNSKGSGDLPIPPPTTSVDRPKSKKPRKSKSSVEGSPAKACTAIRDPSTGKFFSPRSADSKSKAASKGDDAVKIFTGSVSLGFLPFN